MLQEALILQMFPNARSIAHRLTMGDFLTTVGVDLGFSRGGRMAWAVLAPVAGPIRGALGGAYVGVSADAAVGVGLGANALVGGTGRSFALQPVSVEANTGLDITAGVSKLRLRYAP
jgi:hypothetical protein